MQKTPLISIFSHLFVILSFNISAMNPQSLKALVVFKNYLYPELIRTVHFYKLEEGVERKVEREYLFYSDSPYEEMSCYKVLTLHGFCLSDQFVGLINGVWLCIFVFDADRGFPLDLKDIPTILSFCSNSKLEALPSLANDLRFIFELIEEKELKSSEEPKPKRPRGFDLDLNLVPSLEQEREESDSPSGTVEEKKKRAKPKDIASLSIKDLSKHFDLPIVEASKSLKVSLTVLKKKCREFGIPRWPHRKIKSLNGLIRDLQEEAEQQPSEEKSAAVKQRIIESEKESIATKPFVEIRWEIKKFRQDIFKKRHRARSLNIRNN